MRPPRLTFSVKAIWRIRFSVLLLCAIAINAPAQTFTTLHSFSGTDGGYSQTGLIQATTGNLYGTTSGAGANNDGVVFKITPSGTLTTLYSFCSRSRCQDGAYPQAALIQASNGDLYGTTSLGGANNGGTVFKITPSGTLTTIYSFCPQSGCPNGANPVAGLVQGSDGNLYGTTSHGGANDDGTVFRITPSGTRLKTLHRFCSQKNCTDGFTPAASLIQATDGNFYGTTENGGLNSEGGTVFKITPSGALTTLYKFCSQSGCSDGFSPRAPLLQAADGNLYGTTAGGGANNGGIIFKVTPSGTLTTLYNFCSQSGCPDGEEPNGGLAQATDGNLYGTTRVDGANKVGTIFKITPQGALATLYSFCPQAGCPDGELPLAGLVQHTNGILYGTTFQGSSSGDGTVFSLSVGLGPFVETEPTLGTIGTAVKILGTSLTGSTSVTFNGTAATFKVISASEITTTVPASATTGQVQVTTPTQTLTSNTQFLVP